MSRFERYFFFFIFFVGVLFDLLSFAVKYLSLDSCDLGVLI